MVVTCKTGQLLKAGKNVTTSPYSLPTCYSLFSGKKYLNYIRNASLSKYDSRVAKQCDCRQYYSSDYFPFSRESRTSFTKLTPQEVSHFIKYIIVTCFGFDTFLKIFQLLHLLYCQLHLMRY